MRAGNARSCRAIVPLAFFPRPLSDTIPESHQPPRLVVARNQRHLRKAEAPGSPAGSRHGASPPRIVGGTLRGRRLIADLNPDRTRPMKDRVREALFNLLAGDVPGKHAIDLFAGTGALGFEALSRGAKGATLIELHFPTAQRIRDSAVQLDVADRTEVITANTFSWNRPSADDATPWLVFCSPPYAYYLEKADEMLRLIGGLMNDAPSGSVVVVECDDRFQIDRLPSFDAWQVREYPPAVLAIFRKVDSDE